MYRTAASCRGLPVWLAVVVASAASAQEVPAPAIVPESLNRQDPCRGEARQDAEKIDRLRFEPLMPKDWKEFTIHYRFRRSMYHIRVLRTGEETWKVRRVEVDGREEPDRAIHLVDDAREHTATVEAGELGSGD